MAKDDNIRKIANFTLSEKELDAKIAQYIELTRSGAIELPSWPDFCCFIGCSNEALEQVMKQGFELKGTYYGRAVALKKMGAWCEAQLVSNPNWGGKMLTKSIFLLKQGFGGTRKYVDEKSQAKATPDKLTVNMGSDKRVKDAWK